MPPEAASWFSWRSPIARSWARTRSHWRRGRLLLRIESQRRRIDAVAQAGRRWPVFKHVAQVRVALAAQRFHAFHEQAGIGLGADVFLGGRRPETRPAGAGLELFLRPEQRIAAADAAVHARLMVVPITSRERPLRALLAGYRELFGRQFLLPLGIAFLNFAHLDNFPPGPIIRKHRQPDAAAGPALFRGGHLMWVAIVNGHQPRERNRHKQKCPARNAIGFYGFKHWFTDP